MADDGEKAQVKLSNEKFAKKIEKQLDWYYEDPSRMREVRQGDVISIMRLITTKRTTDENGKLLDTGFIRNFQLFMDLNEMHFKYVTRALCIDCANEIERPDFIDALVTKWLEFARSMSSTVRIRVFDSLFEKFKTIASSLDKVGCLSLQTKLLELFKVYMNDKLDRRHGGILDLFDGVLEDTSPFFRLFEKYTTLDENRKKRLLYRDLPNIINRKGKRVESKIMRFLYFDGSAITPYPSFEAWVDFNLGNSSIEFSIQERGLDILATIDESNLDSSQLGGPYQQPREITFTLNKPLRMNSASCLDLSKYDTVRSVKMEIFNGFDVGQFAAILKRMFPNKPRRRVTPKIVSEDIYCEIVEEGTLDFNHNTNPLQDGNIKSPVSSKAVERTSDGLKAVKKSPEAFKDVTKSPADLKAIKGSKAIEKTPESSETIEKTPDGSKAIEKIPDGSKTIEKTPDCSKAIVKTPDGTKAIAKTPDGSNAAIKSPFGMNGYFGMDGSIVSSTPLSGSSLMHKTDIENIDPNSDSGIYKDVQAAKAKTPIKLERSSAKKTKKPRAVTKRPKPKKQPAPKRTKKAPASKRSSKKTTVDGPYKFGDEEPLAPTNNLNGCISSDDEIPLISKTKMAAKIAKIDRVTRASTAKRNCPINFDSLIDEESEVSTTRRKRNAKSTLPEKSISKRVKPIDSSDDSCNEIPEKPTNFDEQFNSLLGAPCSFKGKVQKNADILNRKLAEKIKPKKIEESSTHFSEDSD